MIIVYKGFLYLPAAGMISNPHNDQYGSHQPRTFPYGMGAPANEGSHVHGERSRDLTGISQGRKTRKTTEQTPGSPDLVLKPAFHTQIGRKHHLMIT